MTERVALITGAGGGIGAAVARACAARGDRVVIADIDAENGRSVAQELDGIFVMTDVTDPGASMAAVEAAEGSFGRLDLVMLNAGIGLLEGPLERNPLDVYRKMIAVNIDGVFFGLQAAVPALRR
jgi:NAD(P)-dependent dehydrogenase (short-subunit alcohol dehydrogenase family)